MTPHSNTPSPTPIIKTAEWAPCVSPPPSSSLTLIDVHLSQYLDIISHATASVKQNNFIIHPSHYTYKKRLLSTLGVRGLHAPHPDGWPKAGKTSRQHKVKEVSEVLVASDLWFRPSFPSQNLTLELSQRCDSWSNRFYPCHT